MNRRGFTLTEILVAVGIAVIVAAMVLPVLGTKLRGSQSAAVSQTFAGLGQGIAEFKRATSRYPEQLQYLTTAPVAADNDICGNDITATNVALWRGPYASRMISSTGLVVGDVTIANLLRRVTSGTTNIFLMIDAASVRTEIVDELEAQLDGSPADAAAGTIRYSNGIVGTIPAAATGTYNLSYAIPINSC